ncbi:MAG TPA: hypothetical protein VKB79_05275 [Bryobacteraceae bacterium]|nr:hypothetical protein [Bryobacteraceae bacterium]
MPRLHPSIALVFLALQAAAQLAPPNEQGVAMGHIHLNQTDPAVAAAFFTDMIGAQP